MRSSTKSLKVILFFTVSLSYRSLLLLFKDAAEVIVPPTASPKLPATPAIPSPSMRPPVTNLNTAMPIDSSIDKPVDSPIESPPPSTTLGEGDVCKSTNGVFGSLSGDLDIVSFLYSVELYEDLSETEFTLDVLSVLEASFNDYLVPKLFSDQCPTGTTRRLDRGRRLASIVGISSRPDDSVEPTVKCPSSEDKVSDYCFGLLGMISIFLDDDRRLLRESEATVVREILKEGMAAGAFDKVHQEIKRVRFIDEDSGGDATGISRSGSSGGGSTSGGDGVNEALIGGILAGAAALGVVAGAVFMRRRRRHQQGNDSTTGAISEANVPGNGP